MSQQIVCDSSSISALLKNYEDMEARDNSNSKFTKPINAFLVVPDQQSMRNRNNNLNSNEKSRGNLDNDFSTSLPNLSELSSVKGREPQPGPHSKPEKSESKVSMQNDDKLTESDKEILRNLDITSAVMNLRKFKKMVKSINLINNKGKQHDTNKEVDDIDAKISDEHAQSRNTRSPHERSRSVVQDKRSESKTMSRGDSRDRLEVTHYSNANNYYSKKDNNGQKQGNP